MHAAQEVELRQDSRDSGLPSRRERATKPLNCRLLVLSFKSDSTGERGSCESSRDTHCGILCTVVNLHVGGIMSGYPAMLHIVADPPRSLPELQQLL